MHVYDPFKSTVTTNASTAIPMERETIEDKTLSFATLVSYTRSVPLRVVCHKHVSYHVVLCQLNLPGVANCTVGILNANNTPVR